MAGLLRSHALPLTGVVLLLGILALANLALPLCLKILVDEVFPTAAGPGRWRLLWYILPGLAVIYVLRNILFYATRMTSMRVGEDICFGLRSRLFEHLQQMSVDYYKSKQVGNLSSRVMNDTHKLLLFVQDKLPTLVLNLMMLVALLAVIYVVNWQLAIVSSLVLPVHFLTYRYFLTPIKQSHADAQHSFAVAYGSLVERFLGVEVIKGFAAERHESAEFDRVIAAARRSEMTSKQYHFAQKVAADLLIGIGIVGLLGFGAWHVVAGVMTTGEFFMFFGYVMMLYPAVLEALSGAGHFASAGASVERICEVLEEQPTDIGVLDVSSVGPALHIRGEIEFEDVHFSYEEGSEILCGLNLKVAAGERVAVIGPSGAGKTTMINLIPQFHSPSAGRVLVDGRDVRDWPLRDLRQAVGIAFQEVFLFNSSIFENLLYARGDATVDEIIDACRITGAHDFIDKLPVGYGATPSELGGRFSRGEKQRITLARALIKNPRILILDEATASLDARSGAEVIKRTFDVMQGRTIIMITHDPELAKLADRVITIQQGRVVSTESNRCAAAERDASAGVHEA